MRPYSLVYAHTGNGHAELKILHLGNHADIVKAAASAKQKVQPASIVSVCLSSVAQVTAQASSIELGIPL